MMGGIFSWLIIGVVIYLLLSRKGAMMGCCGGHDHDAPSQPTRPGPHGGRSSQSRNDIIDLKKEDYHVINNS